jgi:hypothetical protein
MRKVGQAYKRMVFGREQNLGQDLAIVVIEVIDSINSLTGRER